MQPPILSQTVGMNDYIRTITALVFATILLVLLVIFLINPPYALKLWTIFRGAPTFVRRYIVESVRAYGRWVASRKRLKDDPPVEGTEMQDVRSS
jgi:hypothetical protein